MLGNRLAPIARQAIAIVVNTEGNGDLQRIRVTDVGNIFSCAPNARYWDQIPGSTRGHQLINKYVPDGASLATDLFTDRTHGLVDGTVTNFPGVGSPPNVFYWGDNFPGCVNTVYGDGATRIIGYAPGVCERSIAGESQLGIESSRRMCSIAATVSPTRVSTAAR